jgi:hypothetical protein
MKIQSPDLIWISGLTVSGLITGWFIRQEATMVNPPLSVKSLPHSARSYALRPVETKSNSKWQNFATQFSEISYLERREFEKNIAPQDRKAVIEALLAQGGPQGFDNKMEGLIDRLLGVCAEENFEETWAWSQQIKGEGTQNFIAGKLLDLMVKTDPKRAITLYLELEQTHPGFKSKVPEKVLASAALKNAEEFLDTAANFSFDWSQGDDCKFAKDFNFQQVADGIAKLPKKEEGKLPWGFPGNFYEAWAERDRDAAFANFTGGVLRRLGDFNALYWQLQRHDKPDELWSWVAEKIQESEVSNKAIRNGFASMESVSFNGIIQALPDTASRDQFLIQLVRDDRSGYQFEEIPSLAISAMSSPHVRLEAFSQLQKERSKNDYPQPDITKATEADLQAWGVTRQQIADIFSVPVEKPPESD